MRRNMRLGGFAVAILMALATVSQADMYNLTTAGAEAWINTALFHQAIEAPAGSGVRHSFVRIKGRDMEQGYNTDWRPVAYDEKTDATSTHSLLLTGVPTLWLDANGNVVQAGTPSAVLYREFILDINQNNRPLLTLDRLMIFQETAGDLHYLTGPDAGKAYSLADLAAGTLVYDLDIPPGPGSSPPGETDNSILLNYDLEAGSGKGDMYAYIPDALFDGGASQPYVYLYSMFGSHTAYPNNDGFEEWAVRSAGETVVPVPGAVILGMLGMSVAGWRLRRFA